MSKSILKSLTLPEWKEADEIIPRVWLGTLTENEHARRRNITDVICISKDPRADLQREGFRRAIDLDSIVFTLESDTDGDMLSILGQVCDVIDRILGHAQGEGVLVWDLGGGVAAVCGYIMRTHDVCWAEAMMTITRARLKQKKPTTLPSQNIIDMLHNDTYQRQLDIWQACDYNIHDNTIVNPSEPREKWIVGSAGAKSEKDRDDVHAPQYTLKRAPKGLGERPDHSSSIEEVEDETRRLKAIQTRIKERFSHISEQPHRLSTIEEVEEEARRLSMILEE